MLAVRGLVSGYGAVDVLHAVNLDVPEGSVVAFIGANGAGKSTLINTISGLIAPRQGSITFGKQDISGWQADRVAALGLVQVPEGRQVIAPLTVEENLRLGAYPRGGGSRADLEAVYDRFPAIASRRGQTAGSLSGGEQQQLAIGRALMARPRLLMLDEPSLGLAPLIVREVFAILTALKAEGATILLVEQNARRALDTADTAYVLDRGRIVKSGPASELRHDAQIEASYLGSLGEHPA